MVYIAPVKEAQLISELKSPVITELQFTGSEDIALIRSLRYVSELDGGT